MTPSRTPEEDFKGMVPPRDEALAPPLAHRTLYRHLRWRRIFNNFLELLIIILAYFLAWGFRFDFAIPARHHETVIYLLPLVLLIKPPVFFLMGIGRSWWRYVSISDMIALAKANVAASSALLMAALMAGRLETMPRSVLLLDFMFTFVIMGGIRFLVRASKEGYLDINLTRTHSAQNLLIVGAGQAGQMIVREMRANPKLNMKPTAFIDDDEHKAGTKILGLPVYGGRKKIPQVVRNRHISQVIIAIPSATGAEIRDIVTQCRQAGVHYKILPGLGDLIEEKISVSHIREVSLEDLLGRDPIALDMHAIHAYLDKKRVLVTGAAGSIGSEICRQLLRIGIDDLILLDTAETPVFNIERELKKLSPNASIVPVMGDIRDNCRLAWVFSTYAPQVVFHAAAYKHVPMMESNPYEAVNANVRGTKFLATAAHNAKVEKFVMISTDKAVNPTNVMGASKRMAEKFVQAMSRKSQTKFITVRFGNVLGSNGSVVPIFREQIAAGGPVTVTHPKVIRFFMTIPEAAQLVMQAGAMGKGGEIFLLDMGEPVEIVKLAEDMIRLSGFEPHEQIEIKFVGLRPGEKLYEELLLDSEGVLPTTHEKIMVARADDALDLDEINRQIEAMYNIGRSQPHFLIDLLKKSVPEFKPDNAGVSKANIELALLPDTPGESH